MSWFQELKNTGRIDESKADEIEYLGRRAELFFRRNFSKVILHGLWFLAEASVCYALDDPLSADDIRMLERLMGDSIRDEVPRPVQGGNTRGADSWEKVSPQQFTKKADELYNLAECLLKGYSKYKSNTKWLSMVKLSNDFTSLQEVCSEQVVNEVAGLIPTRLTESRSRNHKHSASPLAFACELAAREMKIVKKNGDWYGVEYLLRKYRSGGGIRGKQKTRAIVSRKPSK